MDSFPKALGWGSRFLPKWASYKQGFGSHMDEFWLGNDNIHKNTSSGIWELRVDIWDFDNNLYFAKYSSFQILDEAEQYRLILGKFEGGSAGDSLSYHHYSKFSTYDQDNDVSSMNCALQYKGAWWHIIAFFQTPK
ncbi:hypothetical protein GDO86_012068 [Hymenochirus boettgeri]|uniref:Fibrinogen C-terminal domain-containing protein n=1 Tax=Hymenochirus boettgeri TaxID=247094 RepID=A0A8T2JIY6_9PIPI|nr:hypothetical protein GDO86_012068 [Hymenochirus boettgeri]